MDDLELVLRVKAGDGAAFELLVRLHHRSVYNTAFRYMKDHGGADDVVQDTFMKAYNAIESFREESSFKSWLIRIASNTALNALRARGNRQMVDIADMEIGTASGGYDRIEKEQTAEILRWAIAKLPERQRQSLELRIYEDLSFKEVAEVMECPFDTAKANFRHAVMNLKKILEAAQGGKALEEMRQAFESLREDDEL
jgi:RNA polymerase sigma-70 factor (ECF subfamily)